MREPLQGDFPKMKFEWGNSEFVSDTAHKIMMLDGNLPLHIQANVTGGGGGKAAFYLRTMSMSSRCRNGCSLLCSDDPIERSRVLISNLVPDRPTDRVTTRQGEDLRA